MTALLRDRLPPAHWCGLLLLLNISLVTGSAQPATPAPATAEDAMEQNKDEIVGAPDKAKPDPAAEKFWAAIRLLQGNKPADLAAGRTALQAVSDQEYTHAQVLLGNCLLSGSYGFGKDARKAVNLFRLAAERGNAFAKVSLGSCYATGTGVRKDDAKAEEWLVAVLKPEADFSRPPPPLAGPDATDDRSAGVAGELSNDPVSESQATAHFLLGQILSQQKKSAEAQVHYVAAASAGADGRSGNYAAAVQAASNYAFGLGVPKDLVKANEMLDQSRKLIARQRVGMIHNYVALKLVDEFAVADLEEQATETGTDQQGSLQLGIATTLADKKSKDYNLAEAVKWNELAADNGQVWAMLSLGLIYANGDLGRPDAAKAFGWFEKAGGGDKPKHYLGAANLAICYQNGFGTAKDPAKAAALFQKYRAVDIVCYLGSIGHCPTAPITFEQAVALNETWASQNNDPQAQYLLALRYTNGWGVKASLDESIRWFKKAARANHGPALNQLGLFHEFRPDVVGASSGAKALTTALDYYQKGSAAGNTDATVNYANMLLNGKGTPRNTAKAEETYLKCLQLDARHPAAHANLGLIYEAKLREFINTMDPDRIERNRALMLEHYEAAIELKLGQAAQNLGLIYYEGALVPQDLRKAYRLFEQATESGVPVAHYQLGYMHEHGQGVPVTFTEAAYHYRIAALEGHIEALRRLVNFYLTGQGVSLDLDRAGFWLNQLAQRGQTGALLTMCDVMLKKGDYDTAFPLLTRLKDSPDRMVAGFACERLSKCYLKGLGTKANASRAKKLFDQAVEYGNADALTALAMSQMAQGQKEQALANFTQAAETSPRASLFLGQMYYFGTNVEKNRTRALRYLRKAAERNNSEAQYFLAAMTYNREPDAPPLDEAIRLAHVAETLGLTKAASLREKLEQRRKQNGTAPEEATGARAS